MEKNHNKYILLDAHISLKSVINKCIEEIKSKNYEYPIYLEVSREGYKKIREAYSTYQEYLDAMRHVIVFVSEDMIDDVAKFEYKIKENSEYFNRFGLSCDLNNQMTYSTPMMHVGLNKNKTYLPSLKPICFEGETNMIKETINNRFGIENNVLTRRLAFNVNKSKSINTTIKEVIFNPPATIVKWIDGTKTVVKCDKRDKFDKEKGLSMAIIKKLCDNKGNFNDIFEKWIPEDKDERR